MLGKRLGMTKSPNMYRTEQPLQLKKETLLKM
jgi:hypothetical protein